MTEKKKPGRRKSEDSLRAKGQDRHKSPRKAFHAPQELFDALAVYVERTRPQTTDTAVLRLALERFLESEGLWPPKPATADETK